MHRSSSRSCSSSSNGEYSCATLFLQVSGCRRMHVCRARAQPDAHKQSKVQVANIHTFSSSWPSVKCSCRQVSGRLSASCVCVRACLLAQSAANESTNTISPALDASDTHTHAHSAALCATPHSAYRHHDDLPNATIANPLGLRSSPASHWRCTRASCSRFALLTMIQLGATHPTNLRLLIASYFFDASSWRRFAGKAAFASFNLASNSCAVGNSLPPRPLLADTKSTLRNDSCSSCSPDCNLPILVALATLLASNLIARHSFNNIVRVENNRASHTARIGAIIVSHLHKRSRRAPAWH